MVHVTGLLREHLDEVERARDSDTGCSSLSSLSEVQEQLTNYFSANRSFQVEGGHAPPSLSLSDALGLEYGYAIHCCDTA